jgi:hypothetical protein
MAYSSYPKLVPGSPSTLMEEYFLENRSNTELTAVLTDLEGARRYVCVELVCSGYLPDCWFLGMKDGTIAKMEVQGTPGG